MKKHWKIALFTMLLSMLTLLPTTTVFADAFELETMPDIQFGTGLDELNEEWTLVTSQAMYPVQWTFRPNGGVLYVSGVNSAGSGDAVIVAPGITGSIKNSILQYMPSGVLPTVRNRFATGSESTYVKRLGWNLTAPVYVGERTHPTLDIAAVINENEEDWWNPVAWWGYAKNFAKGVKVTITGRIKNSIAPRDMKSLAINGHSYYEDSDPSNAFDSGRITIANMGYDLKWKYYGMEYKFSEVIDLDDLKTKVDKENFPVLYSLITEMTNKYPARIQVPYTKSNISNSTMDWVVADPRDIYGEFGFIYRPFVSMFTSIPMNKTFSIMHITSQIDSITNLEKTMKILHIDDIENVIDKSGISIVLIGIISLIVMGTAVVMVSHMLLGNTGIKQGIPRIIGCVLAGLMIIGIILSPGTFIKLNQVTFGLADTIANVALKDSGSTDGFVTDGATQEEIQETKYWLVGMDAWSVYSLSHGLFDDALDTGKNPDYVNNMYGMIPFDSEYPKNYALIYADSIMNSNVYSGNAYRAIDAVMAPTNYATTVNPYWNNSFPGNVVAGGSLFTALCLFGFVVWKLIIFIDGVVLIFAFIYKLIIGAMSSLKSAKDGLLAILYATIRLGTIGLIINMTIYLTLSAKGNQMTIFLFGVLMACGTIFIWKKLIQKIPNVYLPPIIDVVRKSAVGQGASKIYNSAKDGWRTARIEQKERKQFAKVNKRLNKIQAMRRKKGGLQHEENI